MNSLRSLVYSPHSLDLWHAAAKAVVAHCRIDLAMEMLQHALWIDPEKECAKEDLSYLKKRNEEMTAEIRASCERIKRGSPPSKDTNS